LQALQGDFGDGVMKPWWDVQNGRILMSNFLESRFLIFRSIQTWFVEGEKNN